MPQRTVTPVIYYRGETPEPGCVVVLDRKNEAGEREVVQRFILLDYRDTPHKTDCGLAYRFDWGTRCTECGEPFECTTNNYTKNLPRRCKPCRKAAPYDPRGWQGKPRNRFVRIDPEPEEIDPESLF